MAGRFFVEFRRARRTCTDIAFEASIKILSVISTIYLYKKNIVVVYHEQIWEVVMVMVVYLFTKHITDTVSWRLTILLPGKIGRQCAKAPLVAIISPYFDLSQSPNPRKDS